VISLTMLWAQTPSLSEYFKTVVLRWLLVFGEPSITENHWYGGPITWAKVVGLFSLLGWVASRLIAASKAPGQPRAKALDLAALSALGGAFLCALLQVLVQTGRLKLGKAGPINLIDALALICGAVLFLWVEFRLWTGLRRLGHRGDLVLLGAMHVALVAGVAVTLALRAVEPERFGQVRWTEGLRIGATYMGLVVLVWVFASVAGEILAIRPRRLYAIAWQAWIESFRRMGAPWVVLVIFGLILLFFDWFVSSRTAEMGRSYVGSLMFLAAILMMLMIMILAPISLPNDIRQQTIYTVVSKPVRRLELIWGRMIGYMALVTLLLAIFGGVSLAYLDRNIGGEIQRTEAAAEKAEKQARPDAARQLREQANQLRTRMSARVPVKGSLIFFDSKGIQRQKGIDVGSEMEFRSHVEGASPSKAVWRFGVVDDPLDFRLPEPKRRLIDRRIPVEDLLQPGTIEYIQNEIAELRYQGMQAQAKQQAGGMTGKEVTSQGAVASRAKAQIDDLDKELKLLQEKEKRFVARSREAKDPAEAKAQLTEARKLHSRQIPIEMTFSVYRTTKGEIGRLVTASLIATSPRPDITPYTDVFDVHEYYTDKRFLPASLLVGSRGHLRIEIQCMSPNQYLGMSESDLFLLSSQGGYQTNFVKGLIGVWLQAMVLTAVGVFAGTFLSWPVAFLTTIFFGLAGYVGIGHLQSFALKLVQGGGPFESLIRMLGHDNLQSELAPTVAVVAAKTCDMVVSPVLERLVYLVPNFSALDVSNTVADGFAVRLDQVLIHILTGLGYALPFSIAGYFILKNREVAA
jgi:hypothetical protein